MVVVLGSNDTAGPARSPHMAVWVGDEPFADVPPGAVLVPLIYPEDGDWQHW